MFLRMVPGGAMPSRGPQRACLVAGDGGGGGYEWMMLMSTAV